MATWQKAKNFPGVRFREHPTRKHGVKKDQYFTIRYKVPTGEKNEKGQDIKKLTEEVVGWASEGWTVATAYDLLSELRKNHKAGRKPYTLKEKRELGEERQAEEQAAREQAEMEAVTFGEIFKDEYFPDTKQRKTLRAWATEESLYKLWIEPVIGKRALRDIAPIHLQRIRKNMEDAGRAARSVNYALSLVRQVFNYARHNGLYAGEWPGSNKAVKMVKRDNRRMRFLTRKEAGALLAALKAKSTDVHDMTLLSLYCGLRAGEIFSLEWADVDMKRGTLFLRDTKSGRNRHAYMTAAVKKMLSERPRKDEKVFPSRTGGRIDRISKSFNRVVRDLKLNEGITDPRHRVVFHSCRHTYASWLVEGGTDLFVVKELLGHEQISMTERYSHLSEGHLKKAVRGLEKKSVTPGNIIELKK